MMNKDQIAIFESYRDDILNKFKQSISGESNEPEEKMDDELESDIDDSDTVFDDDGDDDDSSEKEIEKLNFVIKNEEIASRLDPVLRAILRKLPEESQDTEILHNIKTAIAEVNSEVDEENEIKDSPLKVYEMLVDLGAVSEEERSVKASDDGEIATLQDIEDDMYSDDDDLGRLSKRSDFAKAMRRDVERGELEDEIRRMGTDWRQSDRDFDSSSY
jgi:hypothetical protein